jgi:galactose mutarotase-like enzyme
MLMTASDSSDTSTLPDGGQAEATFHGFGDQWPSKTEVTVATLLSSHTVDLTVTVHNAGETAEPIGIGWSPRFAIPAGGRSQMRLRIPGQSRVESAGRDNGAPTGKLLPVGGSAFDYTAREGVRLPDRGLDECFTDLEQGAMDNGPVAELTDTANGYRLRLTALSPEIKAMRVIVPADASYVSIQPQFNYPDPFGQEWEKAGGSGVVVLEPGQSTEWKVRLEIRPLNEDAGAP